MKVQDVVRQFMKKNILAKFLYPARLKMSTESGEKTFGTLSEAIETLRELGIQMDSVQEESFLEKRS